MKKFFDIVIHRWLRISYTLHVHELKRVKNAQATLVFIHGVGASGMAWKGVLDELRDEPVTIMVIDLLGFGKSPKPEWAQYDAATQSRALAHTLIVKGIIGKVTLVGHSMGALIAIDFAKRYKSRVHSMVLCSPPLYDDKTSKFLPDRDEQLKKLYTYITNFPDKLVRMSSMAKRYGLIGKAIQINSKTVDNYVAALKAAIVNQTSLKDIKELPMPIQIVYGSLDPFVIGAHFKKLAKTNKNITISSFIGGHEIEGKYISITADAVKSSYKEK